MNLIQTAHSYVDRLVGAGHTSQISNKIKVLLLDEHTTPIISLCATQTNLLKNEIYLVDKLANSREKMMHLRCVCFLRPTQDAIELLTEELMNPKYSSYELYFSNIMKKSYLERLAEADDHEVVTKVVEIFEDYLVVNKDLFCTSVTSGPYPESGKGDSYDDAHGADTWNSAILAQTGAGLAALLLSLKMKPILRYEANSRLAKKLCAEMIYTISNAQKEQFDSFRQADTPPVLLVLDRKNDPVTPLLTPWTYQAMVHEVFGINNNRVDLSRIPGISKDLHEVVLSSDQDSFFEKTMLLNFGDLGAAIKDYVQQYQNRTHSNSKIESIADMKRFVEDYPEFRKLSGNVSKHVTLVSELSKKVETENLLQISELEQSLACNDSHNSDLKALQQIMLSPVDEEHKLRLVALYALRYERNSNNALRQLKSNLSNPEFIDKLLAYAGSSNRQEDLFHNSSFLASVQSGLKKGLKGVENVYTQHEPLLLQNLQALIRGRLRSLTHPYMDDGHLPKWAKTEDPEKPLNIIVFMIGGATYSEAKIVRDLNNATPGVSIILGSPTLHNSQSFVEQVSAGHYVKNATAADRLHNRVL